MNHKNRLQRYVTLFYAALIVMTISIGSFIYSLVRVTPEAPGSVVVTTDEYGTVYVDPGSAAVPSSAPGEFPVPANPPPTE